nr:hypothetical protein BaRGS_016593 [Batillaria attramentaria]
MVQKLTGRLEKVEEKGNLLDAVEKLGGRMAEKLTEGLEELGQTLTRNEHLTDEVDKLGDKGLDNIHLLTTARNQTLRVDLQDFDNNTAYAEYRFFAIDGPDSFYRLHVDGTGETLEIEEEDVRRVLQHTNPHKAAGPDRVKPKLEVFLHRPGDSLAYHNNRPFSTHDSDHDLSSGNCAVDYHGAWWYNECHHSNLNGPYLTSAQQTHGKSISWRHWKKWYIALKHAEMKIRPAM